MIYYIFRVKKVIEFLMDEVRKFGYFYVGIEYIFFGLICEGEGVVVRVLNNFGVSLNKVR